MIKGLRTQLRFKEKLLEEAEENIDLLAFNNEQMRKRVESLQRDFRERDKNTLERQNPKKPTVDLSDELSVLRAELENKISENGQCCLFIFRLDISLVGDIVH